MADDRPGGDDEKAGPTRRSKGEQARLSASRLAAVQALYQMEMSGASLEDVLAEFLKHRRAGELGLEEDETAIRPKSDFFAEILRGSNNRRAEIEEIMAASLTERWPIERIELLLRCILRAGIFELLARPAIPAKVVINEYVDLADAFFDKAEKGMANAVLDRIAQRLRTGELTPSESAPDADQAPAG